MTDAAAARWPTTAGAASGAGTKEIGKNIVIGKIKAARLPRPGTASLPPARATGPGSPKSRAGFFIAGLIYFAAIVFRSLGVIRKDVIGATNLLEALGIASVQVRVVFFG